MKTAEDKTLSFSTDNMMQNLAEYVGGVQRVHFDINDIDLNIARLLPEPLAKRFYAVAIREQDGQVIVAMANPLDVVAQDNIKIRLNRDIKVTICSQQEITKAIDAIYYQPDWHKQSEDDSIEYETAERPPDAFQRQEDILEIVNNETEAAKAPVVRFVDLLLKQAVENRASDIHLEPQAKSMIVRIRIDGMLQKVTPPPKELRKAVITRIKILTEMDIAEKRLPQDGRFKAKILDREIDFRVSTIPAKYGEKVVIRILDPHAVTHDIDRLGFDPDNLAQFKTILSKPNGIILVTGPTGSGKSTTLYGALNYLRSPQKNIMTIEDPIEYSLDEINQTQVKPDIGLNFARCLRATMRQDPDIILVGEIRDKETMEIAITASLTGHLVLSTFHTNDASSTISRLVFMGLERYLLAPSLKLIIAQRLLRRLCDECKKPYRPSKDLLKQLGIDNKTQADTKFFKSSGCDHCSDTGYSGRLPVFEFLVVDSDIRNALFRAASEEELREVSRSKGHASLMQNAVRRIIDGSTTPEEAFRVTTAE